MYDVNQTRIEQRLSFIPEINQALEQISQYWNGDICYAFAQERAFYLAIEVVTDVGSDMIDGFMMREAASYEDIIQILHDEKVFDTDLKDNLIQLIRMRELLIRQYVDLDRKELYEAAATLPDQLNQFASCVREYLKKELW